MSESLLLFLKSEVQETLEQAYIHFHKIAPEE